MAGHELAAITEAELLDALLHTKHPQIFAESAVAGDGSDWNLTELGILGDISIAVPVTIFDNGNHTTPEPHAEPFDGTLVFTPGALLRNGQGQQLCVVDPPQPRLDLRESRPAQVPARHLQSCRESLLGKTRIHPQFPDHRADEVLFRGLNNRSLKKSWYSGPESDAHGQ